MALKSAMTKKFRMARALFWIGLILSFIDLALWRTAVELCVTDEGDEISSFVDATVSLILSIISEIIMNFIFIYTSNKFIKFIEGIITFHYFIKLKYC